MEILAENISKRFRSEWLFKSVNYRFVQGEHYALLGPNSSGKSTLLKILAGLMEPTEGSVKFIDQEPIALDDYYKYISFASPEMDLILDYRLEEMVDFHFEIKPAKLDTETFYAATDLQSFRTKAYRELSSGLQQKLKLSLALFSDTPLLFLDEPCTNFDEANIGWYQQMVSKYCQNQLMIVASNQQDEIISCKHRLNIKDHTK